ncbi:MAG: 50S ribosomal protein L29 [Myxococcales bacterium]|nr:50S ribosomal protein L29 [Myxococcales bacterium]
MDTNELRECTTERLVELESQLRRQIFDARIKNHTNQLDDTASIRRLKRDLARVKTIAAEKALEVAAPIEAVATSVDEETE